MVSGVGRGSLVRWSLFFCALQALDLYLTALALPRGAHELNPIAVHALYLRGFPLVVIYKAIGVSIVLVAAFILNRYAPSRRAMVYALWGFTLTIVFADVWNVLHFVRMR